MSTPTERRYRREARYSTQLRVTVEPATAAALEAEAAGLSVSAVIRDAVARGLPLVRRAQVADGFTDVNQPAALTLHGFILPLRPPTRRVDQQGELVPKGRSGSSEVVPHWLRSRGMF